MGPWVEHRIPIRACMEVHGAYREIYVVSGAYLRARSAHLAHFPTHSTLFSQDDRPFADAIRF